MQTITNQLLREVKKNKKYRTISDEIVLEEINSYLKKNKIEKITKQDIKEIRNKLHRLYSSYLRGNKSKRNKLLEQLRESISREDTSKKPLGVSNSIFPIKINKENEIAKIDIIHKILSSTVSTKERLDDYEFIYNKIFDITGIPKTILDIGCGLNPISYIYMHIKELNYYAYDIDESDIQFLNEFFHIMKNKGLNGKSQILDVRNKNQINNIPNTDIIFLFKVIDLIDIDNHKPSEELIKNLLNQKKAKFIVASFATKTISKKSMNFPNRKWFELMLQRIGLKFKIIKTRNEIFYIISK